MNPPNTRHRVGLWLVGAFGGVGTTITLGLSALARHVSLLLAVVVGDVVGRGLHAATAMGQLRSAVRAHAGLGVGFGHGRKRAAGSASGGGRGGVGGEALVECRRRRPGRGRIGLGVDVHPRRERQLSAGHFIQRDGI